MDKKEFYDYLRSLSDDELRDAWEKACQLACRTNCNTDTCWLCNAPKDLDIRMMHAGHCICFDDNTVCCGYCKNMYNGTCHDYHDYCLDCDEWKDGQCPVYLEHKEMYKA